MPDKDMPLDANDPGAVEPSIDPGAAAATDAGDHHQVRLRKQRANFSGQGVTAALLTSAGVQVFSELELEQAASALGDLPDGHADARTGGKSFC